MNSSLLVQSVEFRLCGELDLSTAPAVRAELLAVAATTQLDKVVVDLSGVGFADSSGLEPLIEAQQMLTLRGKRLRLRGASAQVAKVMRLLGLFNSRHHDGDITDLPRQQVLDGSRN